MLDFSFYYAYNLDFRPSLLYFCFRQLYSSVFPHTSLQFRDLLSVQDSKLHWAQTNQFCSKHEEGVIYLERQGATFLWNTLVTCEHEEIQTNTFWMQHTHRRSYESQRQTFSTYFCPGNPSQNTASLNLKLPTAERERYIHTFHIKAKNTFESK